MTDFIERLKNVEKTHEHWVDPWEIADELGIYGSYHQSFNERLKSYFLIKWLCTDTEVGLASYFLDGEFVAYSWKACRKCKLNLKFVSEEAANKVRNFITSLEPVKCTLIDPADNFEHYEKEAARLRPYRY